VYISRETVGVFLQRGNVKEFHLALPIYDKVVKIKLVALESRFGCKQ